MSKKTNVNKETNVNRETLRTIRSTWVGLRREFVSSIKNKKEVLPKKVNNWISKFDEIDKEMRTFYNQKSA